MSVTLDFCHTYLRNATPFFTATSAEEVAAARLQSLFLSTLLTCIIPIWFSDRCFSLACKQTRVHRPIHRPPRGTAVRT